MAANAGPNLSITERDSLIHEGSFSRILGRR